MKYYRILRKYIFYTVSVFLYFSISSKLNASQTIVNTSEQLAYAFSSALPGSKIILSPGVYNIRRLDTNTSGLKDSPISVESMYPHQAIIKSNTSEAISVRHSYWLFKGLVLLGGDKSDNAFHIAGNADYVVLENNRIIDFNSSIKVNGEHGGFPDYGLVVNNNIFNKSVRNTDLPVSLIDVVGGEGWHIIGNYVANFSKGLGDRISYGMFLKGNSKRGVFEKNLVVCGEQYSTGPTIGISLGGGGSGHEFCMDKYCSLEHSDGVIVNNVILNCSDVGIYINKSANTLIESNTLLMTMGIDVRFPESNATVVNNIISGGLRKRDGAKIDQDNNVLLGTQLGMWAGALAEKIKHRVSDYDSKYPSIFTTKRIKYFTAIIDSASLLFARSDFGLGLDTSEECFPASLILDISPSADCRLNFSADERFFREKNDFWNNPRSSPKTNVGAIDFSKSTCDLNYRIKNLDPNQAPKCN